MLVITRKMLLNDQTKSLLLFLEAEALFACLHPYSPFAISNPAFWKTVKKFQAYFFTPFIQ